MHLSCVPNAWVANSGFAVDPSSLRDIFFKGSGDKFSKTISTHTRKGEIFEISGVKEYPTLKPFPFAGSRSILNLGFTLTSISLIEILADDRSLDGSADEFTIGKHGCSFSQLSRADLDIKFVRSVAEDVVLSSLVLCLAVPSWLLVSVRWISWPIASASGVPFAPWSMWWSLSSTSDSLPESGFSPSTWLGIEPSEP